MTEFLHPQTCLYDFICLSMDQPVGRHRRRLLSLILEPLKMKVAQQGIEEEAKEIMVLIEQEAARARAQEKARAGAVVWWVDWMSFCFLQELGEDYNFNYHMRLSSRLELGTFQTHSFRPVELSTLVTILMILWISLQFMAIWNAEHEKPRDFVLEISWWYELMILDDISWDYH